MPTIINLDGEKVTLAFNMYANGKQTCITAYNSEGFVYAKLTSFLVNYRMPQGYVAIKNYSENAGYLQQLIDQNIVDQPIEYIQSGFISFPICKLLIKIN